MTITFIIILAALYFLVGAFATKWITREAMMGYSTGEVAVLWLIWPVSLLVMLVELALEWRNNYEN